MFKGQKTVRISKNDYYWKLKQKGELVADYTLYRGERELDLTVFNKKGLEVIKIHLPNQLLVVLDARSGELIKVR